MKYILMTCAALIICMVLGWILAGLVARKRSWSLLRRLLLAVACSVTLMAAVSFAYLGTYYHADETALAACEGSTHVTVRSDRGSLLFDGPGSDTALVFLPGAKVQSQAYAPLMLRLAERGIDCYLMDPPAHMAFLSASDVNALVEGQAYRHWLLGGHSMGGIVASSCAASHTDQVQAVVLLASYPTKQLPASTELLSIYGSEDGCLELDAYNNARTLWPPQSHELVIEGGNHAGFGNYGVQQGDGEALIGADEQQELTAEEILAAATKE